MATQIITHSYAQTHFLWTYRIRLVLVKSVGEERIGESSYSKGSVSFMYRLRADSLGLSLILARGLISPNLSVPTRDRQSTSAEYIGELTRTSESDPSKTYRNANFRTSWTRCTS